jgi:hypothetical protein
LIFCCEICQNSLVDSPCEKFLKWVSPCSIVKFKKDKQKIFFGKSGKIHDEQWNIEVPPIEELPEEPILKLTIQKLRKIWK